MPDVYKRQVLYPGYHFKELKAMTPQAVEDKYHVTPRQYPDLALSLIHI